MHIFLEDDVRVGVNKAIDKNTEWNPDFSNPQGKRKFGSKIGGKINDSVRLKRGLGRRHLVLGGSKK